MALFELLFKYPPSLFSAGSVALAPAWRFVVAAAAILAIGVPVLVHYGLLGRRPGERLRGRRLLVVLRIATLSLVVVFLLRPSLTVSTLVPLQSFVGVLVDDSASMSVRDRSGVSRSQAVLEILGSEESPALLSLLSERFKVRLFSFSDKLSRIESVAELRFSGESSHLSQALEEGIDELANLPLAGLVVLTDGADNSRLSIASTLLDLKSRAVPIYTIGFGDEHFARDIQVSRVEAPREALKGSVLVVEVTIEQSGFDGSSVILEVEDDGRIVSTQEVKFANGGEAAVARINFEATEVGLREFNFRVAPQRGETLLGNNHKTASIQVNDRVEKILYFEGEPRFELKFLRRAVADDENLQLVVLQRTAENRFSRFELDDEHELEDGFPVSREELFRYRGLILGSIEASFFTYDQLRMIADFVSLRGGGFLMLGGRNAFSEGGWAGTPVADVLPIVLGPDPGDEGESFFSQLKVELTPFGRSHPVTRLAPTEEGSEEIWRGLPILSTFNPVTELKPGATSLLVGRGEGLAKEQIVLAFQRYGRGRALAWTVQDSWKWQMHADIPLEDMTHERLWRQMLRWLVSYVPDTVNVASDVDRVGIGERVQLVFEVMDDGFLAVNSAKVVAEVSAPGGEILDVPLRWTVEADGQYEGSFVAQEEGTYRVSFSAAVGEKSLGEGTTYVHAGALDREFFDAELRSQLLEQIAADTGGRYYSPRGADRVALDLSVGGGGSVRIERYELWDMPILFLIAVILLGLEWGLRKRAGMA